MPATAHIALGSNLGDRAAMIRVAVGRLAASTGIDVTALSSMVETAAVGGPADAPPFLNAAATVTTSLAPHDLLASLLAIEHALGRRRVARWEPRPIDLDLLLYGDRVIGAPDLVVPHPRLHERRFVLQPLAEIASDAVHPTLKLTVAELLGRLADAG